MTAKGLAAFPAVCHLKVERRSYARSAQEAICTDPLLRLLAIELPFAHSQILHTPQWEILLFQLPVVHTSYPARHDTAILHRI